MYRSGQEEIDEVTKVILSKQWFRVGDPKAGHLQEVENFEQEWAQKLGVPYALLMCGGGYECWVNRAAGAYLLADTIDDALVEQNLKLLHKSLLHKLLSILQVL